MKNPWEPKIYDFVRLKEKLFFSKALYRIVAIQYKPSGKLIICVHFVEEDGHRISFGLADLQPATSEEIAQFVAWRVKGFELPEIIDEVLYVSPIRSERSPIK